ncbi:MAG: Transketolase [Alphaproteobacteria bacterium MarineAlpha6_Bin4]|nr:MAG: Transketolase [Alphaproteobacteria bacterium MarineAlpha6_Bin3]PPR37192.1 MAG: Transketolase [Alphaproteobacteria bacterium MarineAlpha6_Bin4]
MSEKKNHIKDIKIMTKRMRKNILDMSLSAGAESSHFGGGLSIVEITATLFGSIMNYDPKNPEWEDRDRFILSKGHGVLGYYTALHEIGLISKNDLMEFEKSNSYLLGHPVMNRKKGIEFSNGSLGMGLSVGIGVALAAKKQKKNFKIYVLIGDGECNEGSVWEAAMSAPNFGLNNITAIIDKNNLQQTGTNKEIMSVENIAKKWESFNWDVIELDGHDIEKLHETFSNKRNSSKPLAIIANTIKGKGFSFSENNNDWHHKVMSKSQYELALQELEKNDN